MGQDTFPVYLGKGEEDLRKVLARYKFDVNPILTAFRTRTDYKPSGKNYDVLFKKDGRWAIVLDIRSSAATIEERQRMVRKFCPDVKVVTADEFLKVW